MNQISSRFRIFWNPNRIKMHKLIFVFFILTSLHMQAQDRPYYYEIPEAPDQYTAAGVAVRLLDAFGFRYYWATEGLRDEDLNYQPTSDSRTSMATIKHIESLTQTVLNAALGMPNGGGRAELDTTYASVREHTLQMIQEASQALRGDNVDMEDRKIIYDGKNPRQYPFWNAINGPITDAIWHVGQIVTLRRTSGNPISSGINFMSGTKRD